MDYSPFNDLSAELRIIIYELVLIEPDGIMVDFDGDLSPRMKRRGGTEKLLALTETCKQMRQETMPIFAGKNQFHFFPSAALEENPALDFKPDDSEVQPAETTEERLQMLQSRRSVFCTWTKTMNAFGNAPLCISVDFSLRDWGQHADRPANAARMAKDLREELEEIGAHPEMRISITREDLAGSIPIGLIPEICFQGDLLKNPRIMYSKLRDFALCCRDSFTANVNPPVSRPPQDVGHDLAVVADLLEVVPKFVKELGQGERVWRWD